MIYILALILSYNAQAISSECDHYLIEQKLGLSPSSQKYESLTSSIIHKYFLDQGQEIEERSKSTLERTPVPGLSKIEFASIPSNDHTPGFEIMTKTLDRLSWTLITRFLKTTSPFPDVLREKDETIARNQLSYDMTRQIITKINTDLDDSTKSTLFPGHKPGDLYRLPNLAEYRYLISNFGTETEYISSLRMSKQMAPDAGRAGKPRPLGSMDGLEVPGQTQYLYDITGNTLEFVDSAGCNFPGEAYINLRITGKPIWRAGFIPRTSMAMSAHEFSKLDSHFSYIGEQVVFYEHSFRLVRVQTPQL